MLVLYPRFTYGCAFAALTGNLQVYSRSRCHHCSSLLDSRTTVRARSHTPRPRPRPRLRLPHGAVLQGHPLIPSLDAIGNALDDVGVEVLLLRHGQQQVLIERLAVDGAGEHIDLVGGAGAAPGEGAAAGAAEAAERVRRGRELAERRGGGGRGGSRPCDL